MVLRTLTTTPYAGIIRIRFATYVAGSGKPPFQSQPTFASAPPVVFFSFASSRLQHLIKFVKNLHKIFSPDIFIVFLICPYYNLIIKLKEKALWSFL